MKKEVRIVSLISEEQINARISELASRITTDSTGGELVAIGVLKGAWVFMADLLRKITLPVVCDFLTVSSYGTGTETSGRVRVVNDLKTDIAGRDVLLIEDIVDTGITLNYIRDLLMQHNPKSLRVCVLLDKPERRRIPVTIDYLGFTIPDRFVVGYGVDYAERYRNLPYIGHIEFEQP